MPTDASATERSGTLVPTDAVFRDELGNAMPLARAIDGHPTLLVLGYYRCPNLCTLVFNGVADAVDAGKLRPGSDFGIVSISINPDEKPELARMKKRTYLARLGISDEKSDAWRFLTGEASQIARVAQAAGFKYERDPISGEYAHPAGIVVLTREGRISRYLPGVRFDPVALAGAVREAGRGHWTRSVQEFFLTCLHYDPASSRRGALVLAAFRWLCVVSAFLFGIGWFLLARSRKGRAA